VETLVPIARGAGFSWLPAYQPHYNATFSPEGVNTPETDEVYLLFNGSIECLDNHSHFFNSKNISGVQFEA
jgi:hypothetical protein